MLPKLITSLPGPKAKAIIDRDDQVISPSYTRSYPLVAARGDARPQADRAGQVAASETPAPIVSA